jgi:stalled ribosome rescue protein Dom34
MNAYAGIWIDHEKAYICMLKKADTVYNIDEDRCDVLAVESDVESHIRSTGGSRAKKTPYGPQDIADDKKIDRRRKDQMDDFYETVIRKVRKARKIFIFGPGIAKKELKKKIEEQKDLSEKIAGVESADKMTQNQIMAKVKSFYS